MAHLLFVIILFFSIDAFAVDEERAIQEMARRTTLSLEEIRADHIEGCASGNTFSMRICASYHFIVADLELNDTYKNVVPALSKSAKSKLIRAQRDWIVYRDKSCEKKTSNGYSDDGMHFSVCRTGLTEQRIQYLKSLSHKTPP